MNEFFSKLLHEFKLPLENPVLVFSLILLIILLSPILLKKLNIPGIIGLIISGVVIGPHGLNILEKNSAINLFSTIGLLYIMFIAGLELDMNEFRANQRKSALFGLFTFIIPILVGFPVCYYLLKYDFNASFLTASMFATHTLVAYPIVSKMGVAKNQAVAVTVGGTILTDTAVLIILAVVMSNSHGNLNSQFWIRLGVSLAIFSAIVFFLIPRIAKWFFRKLESEKHSHYIFVLSVVFFAAFLAQVAGVEAIIGAFAAGLALNKLIPHSSALMNRIEFIGNSLFIPFFLISVGMIVNVSVLLNGPMAWIIAGTLSTVAICSKWLAAFLTQKVFRYSAAQRQLIFGLSSSHAAATLAVILVGYNAKILDENILNGTIILILITCIVASFATEKAAKKIIIESEDEAVEANPATNGEDEHILVPIAEIENFEKLFEFSILLKNKKSSNPISILSVVSNNAEAEVNIRKARTKLEEYVKQASASETKVNVVTTIDHNIASGIIRISKEIMADIIVLGWPRHAGLLSRLTGEKLDNILSGSDKTTFICGFENPLVTIKRIPLAVPPLAEFEPSFMFWVHKIALLSLELSAPVHLFSNAATAQALMSYLKKNKLNITVSTELFTDWDDFVSLTKNSRADDLFVLISARRGSASHFYLLDSLPGKMEKHLEGCNKMVLFPQQYDLVSSIDNFSEVTNEPITKGIEAIQRIGKGIGNIFRR
ncbi:cation:proton antiporter [Niabella soli]|uniref:Sodium:proton antiporter n=1 Tax=Niabella soli DSM 19437 TaxID=929713 RepID=W0F1A0_9BACT|nr:cation:proton antiporter [Niabella soli]AHF16777.1 sodium:proton antiporter [Niabella soli DSM 19437]